MSILKPRKPRQPLQAVNLGHNDEDEDTTEVRRRRVSFAGVNKIKEFNSEAESVVICDTPAYEEEFGNSSDSSLILRNLNSSCIPSLVQQIPEKDVHGDSDMDISCINMGVETVQPIYCVSQRSSNVEEMGNTRPTPGYVPEYVHYQDDVNLSEDYMDITGTASPKYSPARMPQHQISSMKMSLDNSLMSNVYCRSLGSINHSNFGQEIFHRSSVSSDMEMATECINKENLLSGRRSHCPDQSKLEKSVSSSFQVCSSYLSNDISSVNGFKPNHISNDKIAVPMNLRNFIVTDTSKSQFTQSPSHKRYRLSQLPDCEMEVTQINNSISLTNILTNEINNSTNLNVYQGTGHLANINSSGSLNPKEPPIKQHAEDGQSNHKAINSENNYLKSNLLDCSLLQAVDSESPLASTTLGNCKTNIESNSSLGPAFPGVEDGKQPGNESLGSTNDSITWDSAPDPHNFPEVCAKIENSNKEKNSTAALSACHSDGDSLCTSMNLSNIIAEKINHNLNKQGKECDSGTKNKISDENPLGNPSDFIGKNLVTDPSSPNSFKEQTKIDTKDDEVSFTSKMLPNCTTGLSQNMSSSLNKSDCKRKLEEMREDELSEMCSQARVDQVFCNKNVIAKRYSQVQNYNPILQNVESEAKQSSSITANNIQQSADVEKGSFKRYSQAQAAHVKLYDWERTEDTNQFSHEQSLNPEEGIKNSQVQATHSNLSAMEEIVNTSTKNCSQETISQPDSATADSDKHYPQVSIKRYSQVPNSLSDTDAVDSQMPSQHSAIFPLKLNCFSETTPKDQINKQEIVSNDDFQSAVEKVTFSHDVMVDSKPTNKNHEQNLQMDLKKVLIDEVEVNCDQENSPVKLNAPTLICEQKYRGVEEVKQLETITSELNLSNKINYSVNVTTEQECPNDEQNSVCMELEKLSWNPLIEESQLPEEFYTQKTEFEVNTDQHKENEVSSPVIVDNRCTSEFKEQSTCDVSAEIISPTCSGVVNVSTPLESSVITLCVESSEKNVIEYLPSDENQIPKSPSDQIIECSNNESINTNAPLYVDQVVENIKESIMDMSGSNDITNQVQLNVAESSIFNSGGTSLSDIKNPGDIFSPLQLHNKHFMENLGYHYFEWTRWTKKFFNKSITLHVNVSWIQFDKHTPILDASLQLDEKSKGKALKFCSSEIVRKLNELNILQKFKTLGDTDQIFTDISKVVKDVIPFLESLQDLVLYFPSDIVNGRLVIYFASIKSVTAGEVQINVTNWDSLSRNDISTVLRVGQINLSNVRSLFFSIPPSKERFFEFACALERLIG